VVFEAKRALGSAGGAADSAARQPSVLQLISVAVYASRALLKAGPIWGIRLLDSKVSQTA
jgi:hypothetical protein